MITRLSLTNRIFIGMALLVALATAVAVVRVDGSVSAQSELDLQRGLTDAARLVDTATRAQVDRFVRDARLIASLPVLRGAVATGDATTVSPIVEQYQALVDADVMIALTPQGQVLAAGGRAYNPTTRVAELLNARPSDTETSWFWPYPGGALLVAAVPIDVLGTLIVGVQLDQALVERLKQDTGADVALVQGTSVLVSTLAAPADALAEARRGRSDALYAVREVRLAADTAIGPGLVALVARSREGQRALVASLRREIAFAGLAAVALALILGYVIARSVTRPIRAMTATMREMAAAGTLAADLPPPGRWDDEDASVLSSAFRQMTLSIDRFQREVAQRERLSALGRLSTVVAHEVRNPLMIITGAVRALRRQATDEAEVRAVADNIDEEVTRLNRVVADVLDYARPVTLSLAPTDLVTLCRDAASAVSGGEPPIVEFHCADATLEATVDGDRLRTALVNLLTNAQHASRDRAGTPPPVTLGLEARQDDVIITITDRGVGMPEQVLSRAGEPFYTTRRAGSGLGLAITRNIIDGLAGTLEMTSHVDRGTTVEIRLPRHATRGRS